MSQGEVVRLGVNALTMVLTLSAPILAVSLVIGFAVSIFQAVTQINEMTLTFVPKIVGIFLVLALFGPWMMNNMLGYTSNLLNSIATIAR